MCQTKLEGNTSILRQQHAPALLLKHGATYVCTMVGGTHRMVGQQLVHEHSMQSEWRAVEYLAHFLFNDGQVHLG